MIPCKVNKVAENADGGYGFSILDSRDKPLVYVGFENADKASEAQRVIGQTIAIATLIKSYD